jgi:hypothetical protein
MRLSFPRRSFAWECVFLTLAVLLASLQVSGQDPPAPPLPAEGGKVPEAPAAEKPASGSEKPAGAAQEKESTLPPGVMARVNGRDITVEEYVGYLFASLGKSKLDDYIYRLLLSEEAKAADVRVEPQQVEAAVDEEIQRTITSLYQGSKDRYLQALLRRRSSLEDEKVRLRQELYHSMLEEKLILKARQVTPADVKEQFERLYGEGGVRLVLRHVLVAMEEPAKDESGPSKDIKASPVAKSKRTRAEARERAERALKEIKGGMEFTQAVKLYSDDLLSRQNEGRIPLYWRGLYGEDFHKAVSQLTPESPLSGVLESPRGFHVVELMERQVTKLEDVQKDLEATIRDRPPSQKERQELYGKLIEKAKIEGL